MPAFVVSERPLIRALLGELLRLRCGARVVDRFASLEECARRLGAVRLVVCDAEGIAERTLEAFIARARSKAPQVAVLRIERTDSCDDIVARVLAAATMPGLATEKLTRQEIDVLLGIASGLRNSEVARRMRRSPKTVEKHRANLQRKLGLRNLAQLTAYAIHSGLLSADAIIGARTRDAATE